MSKPTIKSIEIKAANIPLNNPVIARIGTFPNWAFMTIEIKFSRSNTPRDQYDHFDAVEDYLIDYHNDLEMDAGFKVELMNSKIAA